MVLSERMTVMERNAKNLIQEPNKPTMESHHESNYQQCATGLTNNPNNHTNSTNIDESSQNNNFSSRKNSITGSINMGSTGIPTSTLSLSSTSSNSSSVIQNNHKTSEISSKTRIPSTPSANASRRASGNSITIKVTSDVVKHNFKTNRDTENQSTNNEEEFEGRDKDRDKEEDTTSDSNSNELNRTQSKKKLKERKKLVRSSAQQQHHLTYQESEDLADEERLKNNKELNKEINELFEYQNMNSAFDELFAAAESGNLAMSAMAEAKMAAVTAAASAEANETLVDYDNSESPFNRKTRSRNSSFRGRSSVKRSQKTPPNDNVELSQAKKSPINSLKAESYLGSPQQLTRSCSCKRPGSFKKMKAKSSGVSPSISPNRRDLKSPEANTPIVVTTTPAANVSGRRGTHCSITISEDLEAVLQQNRAGSLPFESLSNQQQQQPVNNSYLNPNEDAEVYRVRQFNITNKGSVINRGDSFKRSFKRSNNSLSSKKETPENNNNTLNLPEYLDNKSGNSSNVGLNEISEKDTGANFLSSGSVNLVNANNGSCATFNSMNTNLTTTNNSTAVCNLTQQESAQTFVVYILGSSSVGKNALIKQFKTSEYRGTYEINANHSAGF